MDCLHVFIDFHFFTRKVLLGPVEIRRLMESESKEIGEREKIKRRGEELKNREKKGSDGE